MVFVFYVRGSQAWSTVVVPRPACSYVRLCVGCFGDGTAEWTRETNWNQGAEVGVRGRAVSLLGADKGEKYVNFVFNDHWGRMDVLCVVVTGGHLPNVQDVNSQATERFSQDSIQLHGEPITAIDILQNTHTNTL